MQAGLVFEALAGGAGTYLQQSIIRLHEPVDVAALRRAWEGAVARNWALRSSFAVGAEAAPTLRVEDGLEVPLVVLDWTDRDGAAQEERFAELLRADRATGFDPAAPPLMRLVLCRLGPTESRLVWSYHHAIIDGRSRVLILRELFDAYEGRDATADRPGPDAFAAFARWTNERAGDAEALAFWEHALRHASPTPSPRRPDPPEEPGAPLAAAVPPALRCAACVRRGPRSHPGDRAAGRVRARARTGDRADRPRLRDHARGPALGAHADRRAWWGCSWPPRPCARGSTRGSRWSTGSATCAPSRCAVRPYEHVPLAEIQHACGIAAPEQVVRTLFVYENASMAAQLGRDIDLLERLNYGLTVNAYGDERLLVKALYDGEGTSAATAERFLERLEQVLGEIAAAVRGDARGRPRRPARRTSAAASPGSSWPSRRRAPTSSCRPCSRAARASTPTARRCRPARRPRPTASSTRGRAGSPPASPRSASSARRAWPSRTERTLDLVAAVLAVHRAGAAYVPLDPRYPPERLAFMLADSGARIVLTDAASADRLPARGRRRGAARRRSDAGVADRRAAAARRRPLARDLHLGLHRPAEGRR